MERILTETQRETINRIGEIVSNDKAVLDAKEKGDAQEVRREIEKAITRTLLGFLKDSVIVADKFENDTEFREKLSAVVEDNM